MGSRGGREVITTAHLSDTRFAVCGMEAVRYAGVLAGPLGSGGQVDS